MKAEPTVFISINVDMVGPNRFELWVGNDMRGTYTSREEVMAIAEACIVSEGQRVITPSSGFEPKSW